MENVGNGMDQALLERVRDGATDLDDLLAASRLLVPTEDGRAALSAGLREHLVAAVRNDAASMQDIARLQMVMVRIGALGRGVAGPREPDALVEFAAQMDALAAIAADLKTFRDAYDVASLRDMPHFHACLRTLREAGNELERSKLRGALALSQSNLTRVLKILEKNRLVQRRSAGKQVLVELTRTGQSTEFDWSDRSAAHNRASSEPPKYSGELVLRGRIPGLSGSYGTQRARVRA